MEKISLPSEEYQRRLNELYNKGDVEGILAFESQYNELILEPFCKGKE